MNKLKEWLGLPGLVLGAIVAVGTFLGWFGFTMITPNATLTGHVSEYASFKEEAEQKHDEIESFSEIIHDDVHAAREELDDKLQTQQVMVEALVIRSCLRDDYEELVLQRLIPLCAELGIERVPGQPGARSVTRDTIGG